MNINEILNYPTLITGASSGIGFACAELLINQGASHIIITGRNPDKLEEAKRELEGRADRTVIDAYICDQSSKEDLDNLLAQLDQNKSWPENVIMNVGINYFHEYGAKKIQNLTFEQIQQSVTVNITHPLYMLTRLLKPMRAQQRGRIILIGSQGWMHRLAGQALYNVSKSSLVGLKNSIVGEYQSSRVFCHLVNPGVVINARTEPLRKKHPELEATAVTEMQVAESIFGLLNLNEMTENGQEMLV